jgi:hypothetical protein
MRSARLGDADRLNAEAAERHSNTRCSSAPKGRESRSQSWFEGMRNPAEPEVPPGQTSSDRKESYGIKQKSAPALWERAD